MPARLNELSRNLQWGFVIALILAYVARLGSVAHESGVVAMFGDVGLRFGAVAIVIAILSTTAVDQVLPLHYTSVLLFIDLVEIAVITGSCYFLGLADFLLEPGHARTSLDLSLAVALLETDLLVGIWWRRATPAVSKVPVTAAHWDFRFLIGAAIGFAYAATGLSQLAYLAAATILAVLYARVGLNINSEQSLSSLPDSTTSPSDSPVAATVGAAPSASSRSSS